MLIEICSRLKYTKAFSLDRFKINYNNSILVLFVLSASFFYQNVQARLGTESIVGGDKAIEGQFKYLVSIQIDDLHVCGGGIIANKYILTAAHCLTDDDGKFEHDQIVIVAGVLESNSMDSSAIIVKVVKAYIPREYNPVAPDPNLPYRNIGDIAVLKLQRGLRLRANPKLRKLKLPVKVGGKYPTYTNKNAVIAGYGYNWMIMGEDPNTKEEIEIDGGSEHILKFAETTVLSKVACSAKFWNPIYDSHLCATVKQRDPKNPEGICTGDSGGPLVRRGNTVIGVANSSPDGCNENEYPAVYARVSSYIFFIKNAIKDVKSNDIRIAEWTKNGTGNVVFSES